MFTIKAMIWLFPILFMLHDFEEIIFVEAWKRRYRVQLMETKMKKPPFDDLKSTASFSIAVAIEFVIICGISLLAGLLNWYLLWYGLFFGFTVHLIIHVYLCLRFRHFVPGVMTSIPFFPVCVFLLSKSHTLFPSSESELFLFCVLGVIVMLLMVWGLHKAMAAFEGLITNYSANKPAT